MRESLAPYYAALFAGISIAAAGQILLKTGAVRSTSGAGQFIDPFTILGLAAYAGAAVLYIIAIRKIPISLAYPTVAITYAVVAVAAHYLWHERIGTPQIAGILLIWTGILLIYRT